MTRSYGYLGSIDVTALDADGEPTYVPAAENRWAGELMASDGKWRFLKGGYAAGRGVGNVLDTVLGDNCTVICLARLNKPTNYSALIGKGANGTTQKGFIFQYRPLSSVNGSIYLRSDYVINGNQNAVATSPAGKEQDRGWHWVGFSRADTAFKAYQNGNVATGTGTTGSWMSDGNFIVNAQSGIISIAATLIYNRVLTDTEVSNICMGKTLPKEVSGLVGYYKFNETHGTAAGQCTDYSGQGNHLTYTGAVWETYTTGGNGNLISENATNPATTTGVTKSGDAASVLSVVDDTANLTAEMRALGALGNVYKLDNTAGVAAAFATFSASVASGKQVTGTCYGRAVGGADLRISASWGSSSAIHPVISGYARISHSLTLSGVGKLTMQCAVGQIVYFVLPQYEYGLTVSELTPPLGAAQAGNYLSGQPYVSRTKRNEANWWERMPPALANPERMGCLHGIADTTVAHDAKLSITGSMSVSCWVKLNTSADRGWYPLTKDSGAANYYAAPYYVNYTESSGAGRLGIGRGSAAGVTSITSPLTKPIPRNKFVHLTWVEETAVDGSGTFYAYVNGLLVGTAARAATTIADDGEVLHLGLGRSSRLGDTRSLRLFSRAITAAEINELYLTDKIADRSNLVGEWMMNEPWRTGANNIQDTSGNGLHTTTTNPLLLDSPYTVMRRKRKGKQLKTSFGNGSVSNASVKASLVGSEQITIAGWVKVTKQQLAANGMFGFYTSASNAGLIISNHTTGAVTVFARESQAASSVILNSTVKWQEFIGRWVFISAEVDYANDLGKIYINGKLSAQGAMAFTGTSYSDTGNPSIKFGANTAETHALDAVRIYTRALSAQEHYSLYLDQAPRDGLVAEYLMDRRNLLAQTEDVSASPWASVNTASASGDVVYLPAVNDFRYQNVTTQINAGSTFTFSVVLSGSGTTSIGIWRSDAGTSEGTMHAGITLTDTPTTYTVITTFAYLHTTLRVMVQRSTGETATQVTVHKAQLELGSTATEYEPILDAGTYCQDTSGNGYHATWSGIGLGNYVQEM